MAITGDPPYGREFEPYRLDFSQMPRPTWPAFDQELVIPLGRPAKCTPKSLPLMASQKVKRFRRVRDARRIFLRSRGLDF